jgi:cytochrome c biogenesis protein CcdA
MPFGSIAFGFLAGVLSTLSPCVLPLLPLVFSSAVARHRFGLPALAAGVVLSFAGIGLFVATIGFSAGLDGDVFRDAGAVVLALFGAILLSEVLQQRVALAAAGIGNTGNRIMAGLSFNGPPGQFLLGLVLGAVWSPCVGPTLGAASVLAAQGHDLGSVTLVMVAFGIGTAVPLLLIGLLSREVMNRWRGRLLAAGKAGKMLLGGTALITAAMILTGIDHTIEAALVVASPAWLTDLTTRF